MNKLKRIRPLLGTFVEIGIITEQDDSESAITAAFKQLENIQKLLSFQDPVSELSRLNKSGCKGVELSPISADVLWLALPQGDFNCTDWWCTYLRKVYYLYHGGIRPLAIGTVDDVKLEGCPATLLNPVRITLDGIAKGYAVDQAVHLLQQRGISSGWINAGGDLRVFGNAVISVYRREMDDVCVFLGEFSNTAIATSSGYTEYDSRFPGMVLDSKN